MDASGQRTDTQFAAFTDIERFGNKYVLDTAQHPNEKGKTFYEVPPEVAGRIRVLTGFDPHMSFVDCLRVIIGIAEGGEVK